MYLIKNYDELYRPKDTKGRDLVYANYVKVPAKPNGRGLQALLEHPKGLRVFGIWVLLLELATAQKPENRGKLLNHKDEPGTIEQIAKDISIPRKIKLVEYAINLLLDLGWITSTDKVRMGCGQGTDNVPLKRRGEELEIRGEESKKRFLDFVFLTEDEYKKLITKFGRDGTEQRIKDLNLGIGSKGYKYKSHYFTILSWDRKNQKELLAQQSKPRKCVKCSKTGVYVELDDTKQQYWLCEDHKPKLKPLPADIPVPKMKTVSNDMSEKDKGLRRNEMIEKLAKAKGKS